MRKRQQQFNSIQFNSITVSFAQIVAIQAANVSERKKMGEHAPTKKESV